MNTSHTITLPNLLDYAALGPLSDELRSASRSHEQIVMEASNVLRVSTVALQLLLVFIKQCRADGLMVIIHAPSEPLSNAISLLGMTGAFVPEITEPGT